MAKKALDWEEISKDREVIGRAEALMKEGSAISGELPQEMCDELNTLTGNKWKPAKYKKFCDLFDYKWTPQETVYALFHKGNYPDKTEENIFAWTGGDPADSDQDAIAFFYVSRYEDEPEKCSKYEQVDVKPLNTELLKAFEGWDIEEDWEANNFVTFRCANRENYGCEKVLKVYNGYDFRMLNCTLINIDEQGKATLSELLKKYYEHVSSDFDLEAAFNACTPDFSGLFGLMSSPEGPVTREFLEENWKKSSYNEGEDEQIDFYMNELRNAPGDAAYVYYHKDDELRELEVVHITARSDNADLYEELMKDEDVLVNKEEEYGADYSAEFITMFDSYLMWFKDKE